MICSNCGKSISGDVEFCMHCGNQIQAEYSKSGRSYFAHMAEATNSDIDHIFNTLAKILGAVPPAQEESYAKAKLMSETILNHLRPCLQDMADIQIGNLPSDIEPSSAIVKSSLPVRWPGLFAPFLTPFSEPRGAFYKMIMELLQLGAVFHQMHMTFPYRHSNSELIDLDLLRLEWINQAHRADKAIVAVEEEFYKEIARKFIIRIIDEKILPFYKFYGISSGFLGVNKPRLEAHSIRLFFAGALLAVKYDMYCLSKETS